MVRTYQGTGTLVDFMSGAGAHLRIVEIEGPGALSGLLAGAPGKPLLASFAVVDETDEVRTGNREANTVPVSLVPDLDGLLWLLRTVGFSRAELVPPPADGYEQFLRGQRAMVAAWV